MILKAIVEEYVDKYHVRVRIPIINKFANSVGATPTSDLHIASMCVFPGNAPSFKHGDIVFIDFEDNNQSKPVIIGSLFNDSESSISDSSIGNLTTKSTTKLSSDTSIGTITSENIQCLSNCTVNIQETLNALMLRLNLLDSIVQHYSMAWDPQGATSTTKSEDSLIYQSVTGFRYPVDSAISSVYDQISNFFDGGTINVDMQFKIRGNLPLRVYFSLFAWSNNIAMTNNVEDFKEEYKGSLFKLNGQGAIEGPTTSSIGLSNSWQDIHINFNAGPNEFLGDYKWRSWYLQMKSTADNGFMGATIDVTPIVMTLRKERS